MLCRKFKLILIKFGFYKNFKRCSKIGPRSLYYMYIKILKNPLNFYYIFRCILMYMYCVYMLHVIHVESFNNIPYAVYLVMQKVREVERGVINSIMHDMCFSLKGQKVTKHTKVKSTSYKYLENNIIF